MELHPYVMLHRYEKPYSARIDYHQNATDFRLYANGDFCEITLILSGRIKHILNGTPRTLGRGDVTFLLPKDLHQYTLVEGPVRMLNVNFLPTAIPRALWQTLDVSRLPLAYTADEATLLSLTDVMASLIGMKTGDLLSENSEKTSSVYIKEGAIAETLLGFLAYRVLAGANATAATPSPIRLAIMHVQTNFQSPLTEADVAAQVHFTPTYFSALFKKEMGVTFRTYLRDLRLSFAHALLTLTGVTVSRAAALSGFQSPEHFSRACRARYGRPPSAFSASVCT